MGVSPAAGTTQMVGSGLKPRRTGLWKVGGSVGSVGPDEDAALQTGWNMTAVVIQIFHGQISRANNYEGAVMLLICRRAKVPRWLVVPSTSSISTWLASRAVFGRWNQESCMSLSTRMTRGKGGDQTGSALKTF